jgi:DNA replication protein DnaC
MSKLKDLITTCNIHPDTILVYPMGSDRLPPFCPVCAEEQPEEEEDQEQAKKKDRAILMSRWASLSIGSRYRQCSFDNYTPETENAKEVKATCEGYAKTFPARLEAGDSMIFLGETGTGKNHLAAAIAKSILKQGYTVLHTEVSTMLRVIKKSWNPPRGDEEKAIGEFILPDLLILDEIRDFSKEVDKELLMEVLVKRYKDERPTILMTNYDLPKLENAIGNHIVDRFWDRGGSILQFNWPSYRRKK